MAKWTPADSVEASEPIGRRLFDEPLLIGSTGQPSFAGLLITHFEESRDDEISVDRLGRSGIDKGVASYLKRRAVAQGASFRKAKTFNGWAVLPARELRKDRKRRAGLVVEASPITEPEPEDNIYHAHIRRPADLDPVLTALYLRHLFTTFGSVQPVDSAPPPEQTWWQSLTERVRAAVEYFTGKRES